jgi:hypothetical protein
VHVVLAGSGRRRLQRRLEQTIALCHHDRRLTATAEVEVSFALLEDLVSVGPFAARFVDLRHPGALSDWLGQPATEQEAAPR